MASVIKLQVGFNDLATTHPALAQEWHPEKNLPLTPNDVIAGTAKTIWWRCLENKKHEWPARGSNRANGAGCPFCNGRLAMPGENDLATLHPELAEEWHPTKNGDLSPSHYLPKSHKKVWWQCKSNSHHEWETSVGHRQRTGCPVCANRQIKVGQNDLATTNPELAREWNSLRNGGLRPQDVTSGSARKVWWICSQYKHEWNASIASRNQGNGCPYCGNKLVLEGFNDLSTTQPRLAAEWDSVKNSPLLPSMVLSGSHNNVWWRCSRHENHSWRASIAPRATRGVGCPICANLQILVGFNDFGTTNPGLAAEWHTKKNGKLSPSSVVSGSQTVVWWQCINDSSHTWQAGIKNRMSGTGCPDCTQYGYRTTSTGLFYFIVNPSLKACKVGITNPSAKNQRVTNFMDSGWSVIRTWEDDGLLILNLETKVLQWIRKEKQLPVFLGKSDMGRHGGWSETFSQDAISQFELISFIESELEKLRLVVAQNK